MGSLACTKRNLVGWTRQVRSQISPKRIEEGDEVLVGARSFGEGV